MPSHTINLSDPQAVLRILLTLVEEAGGELRFKASNFDSLERGKLLILDTDKRKGQIILRATGDCGAVVQVQPESHQWTMPPSLAPTERVRLRAAEDAQRRTVHSDQELAEMEERLQRQQQVANDLEQGKSPTRISIRK